MSLAPLHTDPLDLDEAYWGDHLEVGTELIVKQHQRDAHMREWVGNLSPRCRAVLAEHLDVDGEQRLDEARDAIFERRAELLPVLLVDAAGAGKRTFAIVDVARSKLATDVFAQCRIAANDDGEDKFDRRALLWRLYLQDPANVELVFHLDRTQRKGFARMVLDDTPEPSDADAEAFFRRDVLQAILDEFEAEKETLRQSYCAEVLPDAGGLRRVFIKRDTKSAVISHGAKNTFGFEREWIILAFEEDLHRVHICSVSPDVPLLLANRIAAAYFGQPVAYENEAIETPVEKVSEFLQSLLHDPDRLPLVELVAKNCGLEGSPQLRLGDAGHASLAPAIRHFSAAVGNLLDVVEDIDSIKVYAFEKRLKMLFEPVDDDGSTFIVRYADQPLNTKERRAFEDRMWADYGIRVLSTEKRYATE